MQSSNNYEDNCKYHPNKKAKYKIVSVPNVYSPLSLTDTICSKCAVQLVAQGYKVQDINQDQTQIRQEEIQLFLQLLQSSFKSVDKFEQSIIDKKNELIKFCNKQKERVSDHYQTIIFLLQTKLREQVDILTDLEHKLVNQYDTKLTEIKETHNEYLQMYSDIEVNLDNIISQIDQLPYKQIMGQYNKRVQDLENIIYKLDQEYVQLGRVYKKSTNNRVLGGLIEDAELEIKLVQTSITKKKTEKNTAPMTNNTSRVLSPSPSTQFTSQIVFPQEQQEESQEQSKQRSLSQPSTGAQKFLDILSKVSENQIKTNYYYSSLLKHRNLSSENISQNNSFEEPQVTPQHQQQQRYCSPSFNK